MIPFLLSECPLLRCLDLIIYEVLVRDFVAKHNYQTIIDTLNYLDKLGINAIELMPPGEFENNESWGYNPSFHMALDKYYGTPEKFKELIDFSNHAFYEGKLIPIVGNNVCSSIVKSPIEMNVVEKNVLHIQKVLVAIGFALIFLRFLINLFK